MKLTIWSFPRLTQHQLSCTLTTIELEGKNWRGNSMYSYICKTTAKALLIADEKPPIITLGLFSDKMTINELKTRIWIDFWAKTRKVWSKKRPQTHRSRAPHAHNDNLKDLMTWPWWGKWRARVVFPSNTSHYKTHEPSYSTQQEKSI